MRKTWLIIQREYLTRVRKRSFIFITLLSPLFFVGIGVIPILIASANHKSERILVQDDSGLFTALPDSEGMYFIFSRDSLPPDSLKMNFAKNGYDAFLYIPPVNPENPDGIRLYSGEQVSFTTRSYIENILADKLEEINLAKLNLSKEQIIRTRPHVAVSDMVISRAQEKQGDAAIASGLGYVMGFLIYIVLLIYGTMVMRGVMEEKQNRIIEVMASSVKPFQLMTGKIIGLGMLGLTQFGIWALLVVILQVILGGIFAPQLEALQNTQNAGGAAQGNDLAHMLNSLQHLHYGLYISMFLIFFIGGYLLYSALFAATGSLAGDDDADVQMYTLPLTLLILISIFIMMDVVQQPHTRLAFWASIIPFSSPIVMPALLPFGVPAWQLALSVLLLVLGFFFTTFIAARIYRTAILMYGKKPGLREVLKWAFYKN